MRSARTALASVTLAALASLGSTPAPAAPAAVVVAATAPGFATGQPLGTEPIAVPDGASLVFLLPTGQLVTVKGPYAGPLPAPRSEGPGALARLARLSGADDQQIGGTRSLAALATMARRVPLDLYLSTDRGRDPAYHAGEPVRLVLQVNRAANLYCWIESRAQQVRPLFPTTEQEAAALAAGVTLRLPEQGGAALDAERSLNEAQLRCLASTDPLDADLVQAFLHANAHPLPAPLAERLVAASARQGSGDAAGVVLAQLILEVLEP